MKTKIFKNLSFLYLAIIIASGCGEDSSILPVQDPHWTLNAESYVIPFEIIDDKIIMEATINDVYGSICYEANREGIELSTYLFNKLIESDKVIRISTEHNIIPTIPYHFKIADFALDLTSEDHSITLNSQLKPGQTVLAFIGRDFFKNYEISIDYTISVIVVSASSKFPPDTSLIPAK